MDKSVSKITTKFVIKFLIWLALFTIIGTTVSFFIFGSGISEVEDDFEASMDAFRGFVWGLVVIDVVVAFLATKLALGGAVKKVGVTAENKDKVVKNIAIVLIIFTILVGLLHNGVVNLLFDIVEEENGMDVEEIKDGLDDYIEDHDLTESEEEEVEAFYDIMKLSKLYVFDCLAILIMIPVEKKLVDKKVA